MASLYPSLEDFKYDILINSKHPSSNIGTHLRGVVNGQTTPSFYGPSQNGLANGHMSHQSAVKHNSTSASSEIASLYPTFNQHQHQHHHQQQHQHYTGNGSPLYNSIYNNDDAHSLSAQSTTISLIGKATSMKAPLSGYSQAHKYQPSNTIRPVVICKDSSGKVGLRLSAIQGGVFVVLVYSLSPAAIAGLKFGDQILEINDTPCAGHSMAKVHDLIKKESPDELRFAIRDRPFERTITLHKDQNGQVGFIIKHGKIISIVKDSSAARNGLLINHTIIEVNAQNVVGLSDSDIRCILDNCGDVVVLTILPTKIYCHLVKRTNPKLLRKGMDHSAPEI